MDKSVLQKRDLWLYGALYQMCRVSGVLPIQRSIPQHPKGLYQNRFSPSTNFKIVTVLNIIAIAFFEYQLIPDAVDLYTCMWGTNCLSVFTALFVSLFTAKNLAACMTSASKIHFLSPRGFKRLPLHLFCFMIVLPYITNVYLWVFSVADMPLPYLLRMTMFNYSYVAVTAVEVNISCLCFVAIRAFSHIRHRLTPLKNKSCTTHGFFSLKELLDKYLEVSDFVSDTSDCFSFHFTNIFLTFVLRSIIYAALFIQYSRLKRLDALVVFAFHVFSHVIRLIFMCYMWEQLKQQAMESILDVSRIRVHWVHELTDAQSALLDSYEDLIEASRVEFSACGFFPINLLEAINVMGQVLTYSLVALQSS